MPLWPQWYAGPEASVLVCDGLEELSQPSPGADDSQRAARVRDVCPHHQGHAVGLTPSTCVLAHAANCRCFPRRTTTLLTGSGNVPDKQILDEDEFRIVIIEIVNDLAWPVVKVCRNAARVSRCLTRWLR
jgi:hypothetical protein